jgi:NADH dehydrogenase
MSTKVVVLGAGYAGAGAIERLKRELRKVSGPTELVWVSETDYHFVLHESHRIIRDPSVAEKITIPAAEIADSVADFVQGRVEDVDIDDREVILEGGDRVEYDYLLVALGSETAFYGIPGLAENARTLKSRTDAMDIHEDVEAAASRASRSDPATVVVGGAGLSGIQTAGEVAEFRDNNDAFIDIYLVEALDDVFPGNDPGVQERLRELLTDAGVEIVTGDPITQATSDRIEFNEGDPLSYDVFVWTGGITGCRPLQGIEVEKDDRSNRVYADETFQTSNERVFAIGDAALVDQDGTVAPPTAQAAWQAAEVAGENLVRAVRGQELRTWTYDDKGTLISVGEDAIAHGVSVSPVDTFGAYPAKFLKKFVAARWIADMSSWGRAMQAWGDL